tara:strand:- start:179 stop:2239 length:2061 start_codon:yes stop_codon:yes gene_type:complete
MTDGRRNIRTTTPTKVPGLPKPPANIDRSLRDYLVACGEALEIRLGRKGDVRDRAVTLRELYDSGLAKELSNKKFDPNSSDVDFVADSDDSFTETPSAPVGLNVTVGLSFITLNWNWPGNSYQGHSLTEVWRHGSGSVTDVESTATFLGNSNSNFYTDAVGSSAGPYYYWIRHVSQGTDINGDSIKGPWSNNGTGTGPYSTLTDTNQLLSTLSAAITSSQLASSLATPIGNLPTNTNASITSINTTTTNLGAQYTVKIATGSAGGVHIAGYGLANEVDGGTGDVRSAFIVAADKFAVVNPATHTLSGTTTDLSSSTQVPFAVTTSFTDPDTGITVPQGVYIQDGFMSKAVIKDLLAGYIVGDYIRATSYMSSPRIFGQEINMGTLNKKDTTTTSAVTVEIASAATVTLAVTTNSLGLQVHHTVRIVKAGGGANNDVYVEGKITALTGGGSSTHGVTIDVTKISGSGTLASGSAFYTSDPRTWSVSNPTTRSGNFSVDSNGIMHCTSMVAASAELNGALVIKASDGSTILSSNEIEGTYIKDATVDTLEIAGNAVTVSQGASGPSSLTLTNSYQQVGNTLTITYDSGKAPTGVIMIGGVAVLGDTTTAQTVNVQVRRIYSGGGWNGVNIGQSFASSFGGSAVVSGYQDISTSGAGTSFTVELYASSSVSSNCRTLSKYFLSVIAAKR